MATLIVLADCAAPASVGRGGLGMYVLQWLHGLKRLGHRILFVEWLKEHPGWDRDAGVRYFRRTMERWWHPELSALLVESSLESLYGLAAPEVARIAAEAAALITLAAHYRRDPYPLLDSIRPRILVEQDPGYTHLWVQEGDAAAVYGEHDFYYTVGGNIGSPRCSLPTFGLCWRPLWNPVILDWWSAPFPLTRDRFTTIADWRSYGYLEHEGMMLGPKSDEFWKFLDLPRLAGEAIEIAVNIDPQDEDLVIYPEHGWRMESPEVVSTPEGYRDYVSGSAGEFSCAKGGYVGTRCGWFSDRSACYLAAGRPVVLQATGFEDLLPTGRGLFAVATAEEAAEAIRVIRRDYPHHAAAARALARNHFDSDRILAGLLREVGIGGTLRRPV
jgi:hypothetical protein